MVWWLQPQHLKRVAAVKPSLSLLRQPIVLSLYHPPVFLVIHDDIQLQTCEQVATCSTIDPHVSLRAAMVWDACCPSDPAYSAAMWMSTTTYQTIRCLHRRMLQVATCDQISTVKSKIAYVLSKLIPQRCMTRKFGAVCLARFRKSPSLGIKVQHLVLCSLLGNYLHCDAASRPRFETRRALMQLLALDASTSMAPWFVTILLKASHLVEFALRDYLVFAIEDNPSLLEHVKLLFQWDAFREIVVDTMNRIRSYFVQSGNLAHDPFRDSIHPDCMHAFIDDINYIATPAHDQLLAVCYKRMNGAVVSTLGSLRKEVRLALPPGVDDPIDADEDEDDDVLRKSALNSSDDETEGEEDADEDEGATTKHSSVKPYITPVQYEKLKRVLLSLAQFKTDILYKCVSFFPFFGVSEASLPQLRGIIHVLQEGSCTKREKLRLMVLMKRADRHGYNLLHIAAELLRDIRNIYYMRLLPIHYFRYQLEAIQQRYGLKAGVVLEDPLYFRFCKVCDKVYSLTRDFHSVYKNDYSFGYRDAEVDYNTLDIYCRRDKSNERGRCKDQPLAMIPLLGHMLHFNGKCYILCPQPFCGLPMVVNPMESLYTERGPACVECTAKIRLQRPDSKTLGLPAHDARCVYCLGPPSKPVNSFLYPFGLVLCKKHNIRGMAAYIRKKKPQSKEEATACIVHYTTQRRAEKREAKLPMMKKMLARRKQAARANIRR
jgi:hypothetical protein